jgi:hypothetical protein
VQTTALVRNSELNLNLVSNLSDRLLFPLKNNTHNSETKLNTISLSDADLSGQSVEQSPLKYALHA